MHAPSARSTVRRLPDRASYDPAVVHAILDEGMVAQVAFAVDGMPFILPMVYARDGETLVLHGAAASRLMRTLRDGVPVAVAVTLVDGLVLAKSAFHHSMNYRSVVVFGTATELVDPDDKRAALDAFVRHIVPGREGIRPPNEAELRGTVVLRVPIAEASAKIRVGPPKDDAEDLALDVWAGVLPLRLVPGDPIPHGEGHEVPAHLTRWTRAIPPR